MKKKYFILIIWCLCLLPVNAQNNLDQQVISSAGIEGSTNTLNISSTIGESIVTTFENASGNVGLTQGFHQSFIDDSISFTFSTIKESCIDRSNGSARIDSIKGCEAPYTILWSSGDTGPAANNLSRGNYTVQITSGDGCSKTLTFTIEIENNNACLLKFYSGITPNNDGRNDNWIIDNLSLFPQNEVKIYNRVGNQVWTVSNYNNESKVWKGENSNGQELPSGTYFYTFESGSDFEKGWIELTR